MKGKFMSSMIKSESSKQITTLENILINEETRESPQKKIIDRTSMNMDIMDKLNIRKRKK